MSGTLHPSLVRSLVRNWSPNDIPGLLINFGSEGEGYLVGSSNQKYVGRMDNETAILAGIATGSRTLRNAAALAQTTAANQPTHLFGNEGVNTFPVPAFEFDGSNDSLPSLSSVPSTGVGLAVVFEADVVDAAQTIFGASLSTNDRFNLGIVATGSLRATFANNAGGTTFSKSGTVAASTKYIVQVRYTATGNVMELWINGEAQVGTDDAVTSATASTVVGAKQDLTDPFNGRIARVIYKTGGGFSETERLLLDAYLSTLYGISLP